MVEGEAGNNCVTFYRIVKASFTEEEFREWLERTNLAVRVAKIRGLIPWDYDGERADTFLHTTLGDLQRFDQDEAA